MTVHSGDSEFSLPSILNVSPKRSAYFLVILVILISSCWLFIIYNYFLKKDFKSLTFFFFLALRKRSKLNNSKDNMEI